MDDARMSSDLSDFVLIHSTGQSAAGWQRLVSSLEDRGQRAYAVNLPTDEPELGTDEYARIIRRQVDGVGKPVVVAHSGSGVLLPAAARALDARHQVWLAAWVPDPDASFSEEVAQHAESAFNPEWIGKDPTADATVAASFLYHDCDQPTLDWALTTRRPSCRSPLSTSASRSATRSPPRTSSPPKIARFVQIGSAGWLASGSGSARSRFQPAIARTFRSPTCWHSSFSGLSGATELCVRRESSLPPRLMPPEREAIC
jgi:Alpha/beta hydrolase family